MYRKEGALIITISVQNIMKKGFLIFLILIVLVIGGTYFALNTGSEVDVEWTENDFNAGITKSAVAIEDIREINLVTLAKKEYTTNGVNTVDASFTNAEMSALIDMANADGGPISNFKVSFNGNNEGEISFKLTDSFVDFIQEQNMIQNSESIFAWIPYLQSASTNNITDTVIKFITNTAVNKPVYAKGTLSRTTDQSVSIHIESLKVGQIPMSQNVVSKVETEVLRFVNNVLSSTEGFTIEELRVEDGALYYKGSLPAEIQGKKITD